jgi:aminoglycoside phosphotransferase (APT) family kinase protein
MAIGRIPAGGRWEEWQVRPVTGGANNRLYHVQTPGGDLAIKFTLRDRRARAAREYAAQRALQEVGLAVAPRPILLDLTRFPLPVVVQEWLPGPVSAQLPAGDEGWEALLDHFSAIHSVTPGKTTVPLRKAVINFVSAGQGVRTVQRMASQLPPSARPCDLRDLVQRLGAARFPRWQPPALALCRTDPAPLNFIRRPGGWASVDWENSGWGDPAFEISDLLAHPAYLDVPPERQEWLISTYCQRSGDPGAELRIRNDYKIMQVFWVVRLARYLYEVPRGQDERLVDRQTGQNRVP